MQSMVFRIGSAASCKLLIPWSVKTRVLARSKEKRIRGATPSFLAADDLQSQPWLRRLPNCQQTLAMGILCKDRTPIYRPRVTLAPFQALS
jgi:hypothetical protein